MAPRDGDNWDNRGNDGAAPDTKGGAAQQSRPAPEPEIPRWGGSYRADPKTGMLTRTGMTPEEMQKVLSAMGPASRPSAGEVETFHGYPIEGADKLINDAWTVIEKGRKGAGEVN